MDALEAERIVRDDLNNRYKWSSPPSPEDYDRPERTSIGEWPKIRDFVTRKEGGEWVVAGIVDIFFHGATFRKRRWPQRGSNFTPTGYVRETKTFEYRIDDASSRIVGVDFNMSGRRHG